MPKETQPQRSTEHIPTWEEKEKVWIHLSRWEEQQEIWNHKAKNTKRIITLLKEITEISSYEDVKIHNLNFKIAQILKEKAHLHVQGSEGDGNLLEEAIRHKNTKVVNLIIQELSCELKKHCMIRILKKSLDLCPYYEPDVEDIRDILHKKLEDIIDHPDTSYPDTSYLFPCFDDIP